MPLRLSAPALVAALLLADGSAGAQSAVPPMPRPMAMEADTGASQAPCPPTPVPLPPELAGWSAAAPVKAASAPGELAIATLAPGRGAVATLVPTARLRFPLPPAHPGEAGTWGGLFALPVTQAGTYRVALGAGAWVDMVRDGRAVASVAHGHGPACSPVRKTVDFALSPGRYMLQLSGGKTPTLVLLAAAVTP